MKGMQVNTVALTALDRRFSVLRLTDPKALARLRKSIIREGIRNPVVVSDGVVEGTLVVVDGFKRVRVAEESGDQEIVVRIVTLDATAVHAALLACNRPERGVTDLEEAWVVESLHRQHRLPQVKIGELLARHKSWVCRRLKLVERLEEEIQQDIRLGLLSTSMARELCRLPCGNQFETARSIREQGLSVRQAARLVSGLLDCADPRARHELLADPLKYIANDDGQEVKVPRDPRLSEHGNELRECLLSVQGRMYRLVLACRTYAPAGLAAEEADILVPLVAESIDKVMRGLDVMEQLLRHSRRHEDERGAQASGLRGPPAPPEKGVEEGHSPGPGHRPQDGPQDSQAGGETTRSGGNRIGAGGDQASDSQRVHARPV